VVGATAVLPRIAGWRFYALVAAVLGVCFAFTGPFVIGRRSTEVAKGKLHVASHRVPLATCHSSPAPSAVRLTPDPRDEPVPTEPLPETARAKVDEGVDE
jgi:hypothetical protein